MSNEQGENTQPADDHTARVHPGSKQNFLQSMKHAVHGAEHVVRHERNARIHLVMAILAVALGVVLGLSAVQWIAVLFAIILVFLAEIFNTAIERTLDLIDIHENPHIKLIKDMTAGAVLVASVAAVVVAVAIFGPALERLVWGS